MSIGPAPTARSSGALGLLIVNADDLGLDVPTTDAILRCYGAGRVTSASALVWMSDSDRAATLALECGLPVRLHLNLTDPFTHPAVPDDVRRRQSRLTRHFARSHLAYWICSPLRQSTIERCIEDQIEAFAQLYGEAPRELDGHRHVHTCLNVLLARSLGGIEAVRGTFTFLSEEKGPANRALRRLINGLLRRRFRSTHQFTSLRTVDSQLGGHSLAKTVADARTKSVEVMTHPGVQDECEFLLSDEWLRLVEGAEPGRV